MNNIVSTNNSPCANDLQMQIKQAIESNQKVNFVIQLCEELQNETASLENIVVSLGPYLTSKDRTEQLKAIDFLHHLIKNSNKACFKETEVGYLVEFFTRRLADSFLIPGEVAQTLLLLTQQWTIPNDKVLLLVETLFREVEMAQQNCEIRFVFYQMFGKVLKNYLDSLKVLGSEMVHGFIRMIEGEKDPRCLLLIFHLYPQITEHFDISAFREEMFEVVSCYFPITYNPPKEKNRWQIKRENLTTALEGCLLADAKFAPFMFPLLLEKLESLAESTRLDCFGLLAKCAKIYPAEAFNDVYAEFWAFLKTECLQSSFRERPSLMYMQARHTMLTMTNCFQTDENLMRKWRTMIESEMLPCLENLKLKVFYQTNNLLVPLLSLESNTLQLAQKLVKAYLTAVDDAQGVNEQLLVVSSIDEFARPFRSLEMLPSEEEATVNLITHLFTSLTLKIFAFNYNTKLYIAYLNCMRHLVDSPYLRLSEQHLLEFFPNLLLLIEGSYDKTPRSGLLSLFGAICRKYDSFAKTFVYPGMVNKLSTNEGLLVKINLVHTFPYCNFTDQQLTLFLNFALDRLQWDGRNESQLNNELYEVLRVHYERKPLYTDNLFYSCSTMVLHCIHAHTSTFFENPHIYNLINLTSYGIPATAALDLLHFYTSVITFTTPEIMPFNNLPNDREMPFDVSMLKNVNVLDGNIRQVIFIRLLHSTFVRLDLSLPFKLCDILFDRCVYVLFNSYYVHEEKARIGNERILQIIEALVAKWTHDSKFIAHLTARCEILAKQCRTSNVVSKRIKFIHLFRSMTKALLLVNHPLYKKMITYLIDLLPYSGWPDVQKEVILAFTYVLKSSDERFTEKSHVPSRPFAEQRFFAASILPLLDAYSRADEIAAKIRDFTPPSSSLNPTALKPDQLSGFVQTKVATIENRINEEKEEKKEKVQVEISKEDELKALGNFVRVCVSYCVVLQLCTLPNQLVRLELTRLHRLINDVLQDRLLMDVKTCFDTQINCVRQMVELNPSMLNERLYSLVQYLLTHLKTAITVCIKCRILDCLTLLASNYQEIELLKIRKEVLAGVEVLLNDPKRVVRYSAVKAKCKWIIIGQPT